MVMHSTTKFMSGHSDALGGVLIVKGEDSARKLRSQRTNLGNTMGTMVCFIFV
jgi:cystathionine gamma-synthase